MVKVETSPGHPDHRSISKHLLEKSSLHFSISIDLLQKNLYSLIN
jgi:hypothetical protein